MEIESEIEVSIAENINNSNVDGAIDNKEVCKVEEDEVEELKFESNCNSEDRNEGSMDSDEDNVAIPEGEEHPNVDPSGVEGSKDIIKLEEIDSSERKYRGMAARRKNANAIAFEESKKNIDLNDNRYYGRRLGRSTRAFKQINYNEQTQSDREESTPGEIQLPNHLREDGFFISEEIDLKDEDKENCDQWTPENARREGKSKVGVVLAIRVANIRYTW